MNPFDKLPPDVIISMALEMDLPEIFLLCKQYKRFNNLVCQDVPLSRFWISRLIKDFNVIWSDVRNKRETTPKQFYNMILDIKKNPTYLYSRKVEGIYFTTLYGGPTLRSAIAKFGQAHGAKFLTLIDYIIDHWHADKQPVPESDTLLFFEDVDLTLNNGIMKSLTDTADPELVKYMLRSMNNENIVVGNANTRHLPVIYNFKTNTEIVELFLNKLDRDGLAFWITQLTFRIDILSQEQRKKLLELLRRYERLHDLHITDNL